MNVPLFFEAEEIWHNTTYLCPKEGKFEKDWHVFDDHSCINKNVILVDKVCFQLTHSPVGIVRILKV